jgi:hypothetical protein
MRSAAHPELNRTTAHRRPWEKPVLVNLRPGGVSRIIYEHICRTKMFETLARYDGLEVLACKSVIYEIEAKQACNRDLVQEIHLLVSITRYKKPSTYKKSSHIRNLRVGPYGFSFLSLMRNSLIRNNFSEIIEKGCL